MKSGYASLPNKGITNATGTGYTYHKHTSCSANLYYFLIYSINVESFPSTGMV